LPLDAASSWIRYSFKNKLPLGFYGQLTLVFFTLSVLNNLAFNYNISQPVHMVLVAATFLGQVYLMKFHVE